MPKYRRFFLKIFIYTLPFSIFAGLILGVALYIGEVLPLNLVARYQQNAQILYNPGLSREEIFQYKLVSTQIRQPDILIIGSSRVQNARHQIFNRQPNAFYNALVTSGNIAENYDFLRLLAEQGHLPSIIFIGFDIPDFNGNQSRFRELQAEISEPTLFDYWSRIENGVSTTTIKFGENPRRFISTISQVNSTNWTRWGWQALVNDEGYLSDGSRYLSRLTPDDIQIRLERSTEQLTEQRAMYEVGSQLDESNIHAVQQILQLAMDNQSIVIGYLPPYRTEYFMPLMASDDYTYIPLVRDSLSALFTEYEMPFYDFTDPHTIGSSSEELFDGWHPSELLDMRMYAVMISDQSSLLSPYSDVIVLNEQIASATNPFYVYTPNP